jgi:hypothetical protein
MGDLRPDGNGVPPDDGGPHRDDLPDFPPDWGPVIIPDDASELDDEADALRRELRRHARQSTLRAALGLRPPRPHSNRHKISPLGIPAVIMAVALLVTLISLLVVVWGSQPTTTPPSSGPLGPGPVPATTNVSDSSPEGLGDIVLNDADGRSVRLDNRLPAVVLLVDRCDCATLAPDLAALAPTGVSVVAVAERVTGTSNANVQALADPNGLLRAKVADPARPAAPAAIAVLLDSRGGVVAIRPGVLTAAELSADMAKLVS